MDSDELYRALQRHLDRMPVAYPATESGVEIRILKRLFTEDEARLALCLSAIPETLRTIHRRMRQMTLDELRGALDRLADKGCIRKFPGKTGPVYGKSPLVLGMYEDQVNRLTPELERDFRAYMVEAFGREAFGSTRTPQMRTVPVHKSIPVEHPIATYNDIRKIVEEMAGPFAVIPCVCRQGRALTGEPCKQTSASRNCLMFGRAATMMTAKGIAEPVSREEMLDFLDRADREGLVLQPGNTTDLLFACCCCGCCCGVLTTAKKLPKPADFFQSDFLAAVDREKCQSCGTCVTRCQMDAIAQDDGPAVVTEERCIGCGLCVTTCPSEALSLGRKERRPPPPKDMPALYMKMLKERYGQLGAAAALAGHFVGRKF